MVYAVSLIPLTAIYAMLVLGLNLQFGQAGILNFAYISFVAMGAYVSAVLSMGPPDEGTVYVGGASIPFPLNVLAGAVAATVLGLVVSLTALRRLRSDYLAIVTIAAGQVFYTLVGNVTGLFNGWQGLDNVPIPVPAGLGQTEQQLVFGGIAIVFLALTFAGAERIRRSPLGRVLRSIREDETVTEAFGRDAARLKLLAFLLGSFVAGAGGGLFVAYLSAYNPAAFVPADTFLLWAAMFVGGVGNNWGSLLGGALIPVGFVEATRFLPNVVPVNPILVQSLRGVAIGLLIIFVPWLRPQGILPERLPRDRERPAPGRRRDRERPGPGRRLDRIGGRATATGKTILEVENVSKRFGGLEAVRACSFDVRAGTVTGLIGPNGAGKSTTSNLIAGELRPDSGRILFEGKPIHRLPPHEVARRGIARTFQLAREFDRLTVMENLLLGPYPQRGESLVGALFPTRRSAREQEALRVRARAMLALFELTPLKDEPAGNLSGGQKKLLELARALMAEPRLLLMDEPTAGINPALLGRLLEHIRSLRDLGVTVLIIEHNLAVIESVCDDVVVMAAGSVLARGTLAELRRNPAVVEAYLGETRAHGAA